ncbi:energy-coupling factor transporter transmembrane component T family protein [Homoserinimonas sp. A520]
MTATFEGINPVAKLAAVMLLSVCLILSLDWVSGTVALAFEAVLLPFAGVPPRKFWLRTLPVWIAAPLTGLTIALYGEPSGAVYFEFWAMRVSDGSLELAVATVLRVLAIGLPAVVLFLTVDPTALADGLAQVWKLPSRFVLGALAALRLVGLFLDDWRSLEVARRARGVGDRGRIRRLPGQAFALLVLSIRRGSKLATAMEARGFGSSIERTWARPSRFGAREWALSATGLVAGLSALAIAIATGEWNFVLG